jgi:transcriptional regulator with XRE-family HTH domain
VKDLETIASSVTLKIAQSRIAKNISAYALSTTLGKNKNYISRIESGSNNITLKALIEICQVLEINPKDLF